MVICPKIKQHFRVSGVFSENAILPLITALVIKVFLNPLKVEYIWQTTSSCTDTFLKTAFTSAVAGKELGGKRTAISLMTCKRDDIAR